MERTEVLLGRLFATTATIGAALSIVAWWAVDSPIAGLVVAVLLGVAELIPARVREGVWVSLSSVVVLTAILLAGPSLGVCAAVGFFATWRSYERRQYPRTRIMMTLFNVGQVAISAAVAGSLFVAMAEPVQRVSELTSWTVWGALLASAILYTVINHGFVAVAVHLAYGERLSSALGGIVGTSMILQILYAALALLAAALWLGTGPWGLAFLVVPMLVARQALLAFQREEEAYDRLVSSLLKAIEVKDGYTAVHTGRVSQLCSEVARDLGFDYDELRVVRYAAKLHDVGKLGVPIGIINKPASLDEDEYRLIKQHPHVGSEILSTIDFLRPALDGVLHHHERVDGGGYPDGLVGEDIPILARIITVCDAFDAMTSTRSYSPAIEVEPALEELRRCAGTQFDAAVVETLAEVVERIGWEPLFAPTTRAEEPSA